MGETWYRVEKWRNTITPVVAESSTSKTLTVRSRLHTGERVSRTAKECSTFQHFPTWQEAHTALVTRNQERVRRADDALDKARRELADALLLTPPDATGAVPHE